MNIGAYKAIRCVQCEYGFFSNQNREECEKLYRGPSALRNNTDSKLMTCYWPIKVGPCTFDKIFKELTSKPITLQIIAKCQLEFRYPGPRGW